MADRKKQLEADNQGQFINFQDFCNASLKQLENKMAMFDKNSLEKTASLMNQESQLSEAIVSNLNENEVMLAGQLQEISSQMTKLKAVSQGKNQEQTTALEGLGSQLQEMLMLVKDSFTQLKEGNKLPAVGDGIREFLNQASFYLVKRVYYILTHADAKPTSRT